MKRALLLALVLLAQPRPARACETTTIPAGLFVLDGSYLQSNLDQRWDDARHAQPLIDPIRRYEPGGGLQGTLTAQPTVRYQLVVSQLYYGITDHLMAALAVPLVLKTTIHTNLGWQSGDYQPAIGRSYSESDFWSWAQSMGQGKPPATWQGNRGTLADLVVGTRYRLPQIGFLRTLGVDVAGTLLVALPTGKQPDPEELVAAGTTTWELHSYGDAEVHLAASKAFFTSGEIPRAEVSVDGYYAYFRPRTYQTPSGTRYPLLLDQAPYVGSTYVIDPGDWLAGRAMLELSPVLGPTRASFVSHGQLEKARRLPALIGVTLGYSYIHCAATTWTSQDPKWDAEHEQPWRAGDKNVLIGALTVSLLRVGLPLQLYGGAHVQSLIPGKNTRAADSWSAGARAFLQFW